MNVQFGRVSAPIIEELRGDNIVPFPGTLERYADFETPADGNKKQRALSLLVTTGPKAMPQWRPGERLDHLIARSCEIHATREAVITEAGTLTYRALDARANQLARHLVARGIRAGDRIGLLFDKTADTYVALLAVLKANAVYVPLDPAFPRGRLTFIAADANLALIISMSPLASRLEDVPVARVLMDDEARAIGGHRATSLDVHEIGSPADDTCYIIYTSGTTGNPKGVIVEHASICNFVRVAGELYGFSAGDRIYQGMTIAFDFSVEEIWVPLSVGAALVPGKQGRNLVGDELGDFLHDNRITCLCCCPTLIGTIERPLPDIRVLLVGGEACPQNLVERWYRDGRTILNSYGPTEATVTAMLTELRPDKAVTIGKPLPTYSIVVLDPEEARALPVGEAGEIGIAGIGVARGYLGNDDLTARKFIPDFLEIANNPSGRIYRTGDLGRLNANGEVEYLGRIDTQVKIRGYRIELSEIEAVILEFHEIAQAAVWTFEPEPGQVELVAYYVTTSDGQDLDREALAGALRTKLPNYMVPSYLEHLDSLPMSVSNKTDYKRLPPPAAPRFLATAVYVAPATDTERTLAAELATILRLERVSIGDDFFQDLGANSLLMARFCTRVRATPALAHISMPDIYFCPTIRDLASQLDRRSIEGRTVLSAAPEPLHEPSDLAYWGCGSLQLAAFAGYALLVSWLITLGFSWIEAAPVLSVEQYLKTVTVTALVFLTLSALPIAAKWLLVGRWQAAEFPIWSLAYFRFWLIKTLVRTAPVSLLVGTPIYNVYLRLLGARIGRGAIVASRYVPVTTDLFSVGENSILRKDSVLLGYRAQSNVITTGRIDIGANAFVGEAAVLDIDTAMGRDTQLGHASSLQSGQRVPDGRRYHGSPAIETTADYCPLAPMAVSDLRRIAFSLATLAGMLLSAGPVVLVAAIIASHWGGETANAAYSLGHLLQLAVASLGLYLGSLVLGVASVLVIPRLCQRFLKAGTVYPVFGVHYWMQRTISASSNSRLNNLIFGDSSLIVYYMRAIGWNLGVVDQTGSNFGTNQRHDNPFLCHIGSGTMVSDGLSMINVHMSASAFRLEPTRVGAQCYFGNDIHFPPNARTGNNCLLGTKVLVPIDGPVRENVGLLGSPSFEIPRMVERDRKLLASLDDATRRHRVRDKLRHNLVTIALFLASRWLFIFILLLAAYATMAGQSSLGIAAAPLALAVLTLVMIGYFALIERASLAFGRLRPSMITIYDPEFWQHERHWKLSDSVLAALFVGTPFRNIISRLLGVKVGRKVYDGGAMITERTLTEIGDYANLNEGSVLQAHSLEEGAFKSDVIRIGRGATVGPAAFVHYGATMGERAVLDADSFLIKGETMAAGSGWRGNPARLHRAPDVLEPATRQPAVQTMELRKLAALN